MNPAAPRRDALHCIQCEDEQVAALPSLTLEDVGAFVQVLTALAMMGSTRIEIHPARWHLIFTGLILHRAYDIHQVKYVNDIEDIEHAVMELEFATEQGKVGCLLMRRGEHHGDETLEQSDWLDSQGPCYDVPKTIEMPDNKIWMPS
jgi:hypothetical protein